MCQRYKIVSPLGSGGMGEVYRAHDQMLDRHVAIKILPQEALSNPVSLKRFEREAKALASLSHPNVLAIYDYGIDNEISFTVTELLKGETLRARMRSRIPWKKVLKIAMEIAEGLSGAHDAGVVHRDLKPENIFITSGDQVKILDFGLAKKDHGATNVENQSFVTTESRLTAQNVILGTVPYMSPEQVGGDQLDFRTDIFSFGAVLYEMLTGSRAFQGETNAETMAAILKEDPTSLPADVPPSFQRIVSHCLNKIPEKRFQSARDLVFALTAVDQDSSSIQPTPPQAKSLRLSPRHAVSALLIVILVVLGWFLSERFRTKVPNEKSIAVLPFTNLNAAIDDEYFSDGITEDVIAQLSKINDLKVISRTSVMSYKHTNKNLRDIGRELGATVILEGSVRRSGNRVRIVSQLINVSTDKHIWAATYDRDLRDVFEIQSDVAEQIALALEAQLSPAEKQRIESRPTENLAAYDLYLKGRQKMNELTEESNNESILLFKKAIEMDPKFALASAGLADSNSLRLVHGTPESVLPASVEYSNKAISLDPNLAEGYGALGYAYHFQGRYREALAAEKKALELNPNYARAAGVIGKVLFLIGRTDEALPWVLRFRQLEPVSKVAHRYVGDVYRMLGDYSQAEQSYLRCTTIDPNYAEAYILLAIVYLYQGNDQKLQSTLAKMNLLKEDVQLLDAIANTEFHLGHYQKAKEIYLKLPPGWRISNQLGYCYWKEGNRIEAEKIFNTIKEQNQKEIRGGVEGWGPFFTNAEISAIHADSKEACEWLRRAIAAGLVEFPIFTKNPMFENIRSDRQFQQLAAELQTKVTTMRRNAIELLKLPQK